MMNLYNRFDLTGLLDSYRPICFHGGGAKVTLHNAMIQYYQYNANITISATKAKDYIHHWNEKEF